MNIALSYIFRGTTNKSFLLMITNTCMGPRKPFLSLVILLSMSSLLDQKGLNNFLAIDKHVHYPKIDDRDKFGNHLTRLNFTPTFSL